MASSKFELETIFKGKDLGLSKMLNRQIRLQRKLNSLKGRAEKQARAARTLQSASTKGLIGLGAGAIAGAAGIFKITEAGREFDSEMSKVQANMGKATWDQDMDRLRESAANLGKTTEFTSAQAAQGLNELAKAGFTTEQSLASIEAVLNGASAGGLELADAAGIMTSTLAGFGMKGKTAEETARNSAHVMDVLATAASTSKSSIATLGESLKSVSPVAKQFGFSLTDSVAMVAKMQDVGIEASEAGNAVKTMLTKLTKPSAGMMKMMKKMGVSFVDTHGDMLMPEKIFEQANLMQSQLKGNAKQAAAFADIVGLRGQKALTVLASNFSKANEEGDTFSDVLKKSAGAAKQMAETKLNNLNGDITKMSSAWDGLTVAINDALKGALRPLIQDFTEWMGNPETQESIVSMVNTFKEWAPVLFDVLKVVGLVISSVWIVTTAMKAWTAATVIFNAVMMLNPVAALFMAIVAAIMLVIYYWDEFKIGFLMGIDLMMAPLLALYNLVAKVANTFGATMELASFMGLSDGEMARQDEVANQEARARAAKAQSGKQGGGGNATMTGEIGVKVDGPAKVTTKSTGPVALVVPNSASFT